MVWSDVIVDPPANRLKFQHGGSSHKTGNFSFAPFAAIFLPPLVVLLVYRTCQRLNAISSTCCSARKRAHREIWSRRLKTFGVGTELDRRGWLSVFRQLVAQGVLLPDSAGHGGLYLGPGAAEILRGAETVHFRQDSRIPRASATASPPAMLLSSTLLHGRCGTRCGLGGSPRRAGRRFRHTSSFTIRHWRDSPPPASLTDGLGADPGDRTQQARALWRRRHRDCRGPSQRRPHQAMMAREPGQRSGTSRALSRRIRRRTAAPCCNRG